MKNQIKKCKKDIIQICRLLADKYFVSATDGNVSVRVGENRILITPSGINKKFLKKKQLILTDLNGKIIEGKGKASSEIKLHLNIYKLRKDVNAVIHAHPPMCIAFTIAGLKLEEPVLPEVVLTMGKIPTAKYAAPTTEETAISIEKYIKEYNAILLERHGVVTTAEDIYKAYNLLEKTEHTAHVSFYAHQLGGASKLGQNEINELLEIAKKLGIKNPLIK